MVFTFQKHQFTVVIVALQIIFFVLFAIFGEYSKSAMPGGSTSSEFVNSKYPMFQDVNAMIFVGFGFLMTFLRRYGFSAVSINMLLACIAIEWGIIVRGLLSDQFHEHHTFTISIDELITADFGAAVVLITMGAVLGRLSPVQYVLMVIIELAVALPMEHVVVHYLHINDVGGSIVVHTFGAYFGLALSRALYGTGRHIGNESEGSTYNSDIFSMIGSLFLWIYWPSFNAAVATPEDARHRAVINTFLSITASTVATFLLSQMLDHKRRISMTHVANATLAGGVAIGTTANVVLQPVHALFVGTAAGLLSVLGFVKITPMLAKKLKIHDTCGVNNLHGMPGILAGLLSALFVLFYEPEQYHSSLSTIYPAWTNTTTHNATKQAAYQLAGLGAILISALVSGFITGLVLKLRLWNQIRDLFADQEYFETPDDYDFTTRIISRIDHVELTEKTALTVKESL